MATTKSPTTEAQIRVVAEAVFRAWNDHDVEAILAHLADDVVWSEPSLDEPTRGKLAVAADLKDTFTTFPDLHFPVEGYQVFPSADQEASVGTWTLTATMTGSSKRVGVPATGKSVLISGTVLTRFSEGLISEYTTYYDMLDFMQQLGLLPKSNGLGFKAVVMADLVAGKALKALHR